MADFIAFLVIVAAVGAAAAYIVRQKRRGVKCIGCTAGQNACSSACGSCSLAKDIPNLGDCAHGCPAAERMVGRMEGNPSKC